ncbi:hypothetical protein [Streptomyces katrae]|uniref:Type III effector protein n=1 Tax=Streptomyces katrae TaxID=68223 RepID=A0A0F4IWF6_9ACTN|nr:hypothetical protein [Streptomyces katrae]KJY25803.1 hypothetical protein VR44_31550 [Streptomyces katrae]
MPAAAPSPSPGRRPAGSPASFLAAAAALAAIERELGDAHGPAGNAPSDPREALAALLLLREVREQLAGWESGLIETARAAGASWADLAAPLGVASRQAAERRYLRRVQATRDGRAAQRAVDTWARDHAADLRRLAGQVTALTPLDGPGRASLGRVHAALAGDDPADLVDPLTAAEPYVRPGDPTLADRIAALLHETDRLRHTSDRRRRAGTGQ